MVTYFRPPRHTGCESPRPVRIQCEAFHWWSVNRPFNVELRLNGLPELTLLDVSEDGYCDYYPVGKRATIQVWSEHNHDHVFIYHAIVATLPNGDEDNY